MNRQGEKGLRHQDMAQTGTDSERRRFMGVCNARRSVGAATSAEVGSSGRKGVERVMMVTTKKKMMVTKKKDGYQKKMMVTTTAYFTPLGSCCWKI